VKYIGHSIYMDLNRVSQKNIDQVETNFLLQKQDKVNQDVAQDSDNNDLLDTATTSGLDDLSQQVSTSTQASRAAYLEALRVAIANDTYDVSSDSLADSILNDGFAEFLID
jgi:anti-sigma28 factor (negative regulator of flagellin synthesis)